MRLYHHPLSPYSRKVRAALLHRGDAHEAVVVDVRGGELHAPWFRALSPFGKIPVAQDGDAVLFESTSIIDHVEQRGPRVWLPRGAEAVARHWDRVGDLYLIEPMSTIFFRPGTPEATEAQGVIATSWRLIADRLDGRRFLAGDLLTLADLSGAIATDYLERLGGTPPPAVAAWKARVTEAEGLRAAADEAEPHLADALARRAARL